MGAMTVYVDDLRANFRRMKMCYCWADTREELFLMMVHIGVSLKRFQCSPQSSWEHFAISLSKRALAVKAGAVETDEYGPAEHIARLEGNAAVIEQIAQSREMYRLD
jgi:hypothetical protein